MTVTDGPLLAPVLARVIGIHAARAGLPVDRLADAVLIADAIAARATDATVDGRLPVSVRSDTGRLEIRIGPLRPGAAVSLLENVRLPETGAVLERLADEVHIRPGAAGGEVLVLRLAGAS